MTQSPSNPETQLRLGGAHDLSHPNRGGHVEDVADVVQCEVVGVLRGILVPNEDVRVDLVHPRLLPAKVSRQLGSDHLVTLLGCVGLRSIEVVIRLSISNTSLYTIHYTVYRLTIKRGFVFEG